MDREKGKIDGNRYIQGYVAGMTQMLGLTFGENVFCLEGCPQQRGIIHSKDRVIHRDERV